jgi:peptide/nickel transport system substrate-binding protein
MHLRKLIAFALIVLMVLSVFTGCKAGSTETPKVSDVRKETLFVTGMQWNPAQNFNWFSGWPAWPTNNQANPMVYEPLFLYNSKTNDLVPFVATEYKWSDRHTLEVKLNKDAKFSDNEALDSSDVFYTMDVSNRHYLSWTGYVESIEAIETPDPQTVIVKFSDKNFNQKNALEMLTRMPILPEHIWEKVEADMNGDTTKIAEFFNDKPVGSGAYLVDFYDEQQIRTVRNDNWWGKTAYGLPKPKYITHLIYNSNDASTLDLKNGKLDYSENFISKVWELKDSGVKTYMESAPYYPQETLPTFYINLHKTGLDMVEVRRAIAHSFNYADITDKAMNGYSEVIEPSLLVFDYEKELLDETQIKDLVWTYNPDKANEILDGIGAVKGADGIRVLPDGTRMGPWKVECPAGWTDWNATIEIATQNAKAVGIELVPSFVEWGVYDNNKSTGNFDLIMDTPAAYSTPGGMFRRAHALLSSENLPVMGEAAYWNYGRYENKRVNELLTQLGSTVDPQELKKLVTELNVIYLTDVPTIPLYYRPTVFSTVSEQVWKNFATEKSTSNLPGSLFDGAGYLGLFQIDTN